MPVLYVDLDPDEESLVLATLDPIGAMAGRDDEKLRELLAEVTIDDAGLLALLGDLKRDEPKAGLTDPDEVPEPPEKPYGLRDAKENLERTSTDGISPDRAVAWLQELSATWRAAEVPAERADVLHAIYDRITIAGRKIVSVRLTPSAYAHGFALALPEKVAVARPTVSDAPDRC